MRIAKEASPPPHTPPETLSREQNGFALFIGQHRDLFEGHTSSTYKLRDEEQAWRGLPEIDSFVNRYGDLAQSLDPEIEFSNNRPSNRWFVKAKNFVLKTIFIDSGEKSYFIEKTHLPLTKANPEQRAESEALNGSVNEFRANFFKVIAPLAAEVEESKTELLSIFRDYLLLDPEGIFCFRDFLTDKKYVPSRETIKPFLASFVQNEDRLAKERKKGGILSETVQKWKSEISKQVTPALIDEFVLSIKPTGDIREWLKFAAQGEDIANYLKSRPDVSNWPSVLKHALSSFVSSKYVTAHSSIEKALKRI